MNRTSGVLMHISSLYGEYGVGSLGKEAFEWIDFLEESGFHVWQVLPFCLPDSCHSPYKSFGAFSLNPDFIDLYSLYEEGLLLKEELNSAFQKSPYSVEFEILGNNRLKILEKAASRFSDWKKVDEFLLTHKETDSFCMFMAQKEMNNGLPFQKWKTENYKEDTLKLWRFTQYIFYTQWKKIKDYANKKGISIIGDIPIYVDLDSADCKCNKEEFLLDENLNPKVVAGVPPDYFCPDGQNWGNPIYDWNKMKKNGFLWWENRLKFMCELFDGMRIDHFRGLSSYYSVPFGEATARNGKWEKGPGIEFIRKIQKVCKDTIIIAEDLGDIDDEVRELVNKSGFPGMRVLQFGFLSDSKNLHLPHNYVKNSVAYTGTHDNNTLLGYIWEIDDIIRKRLFDYVGYKGVNWEESYDLIMKTMYQTHSDLLIMPIQDLLFYGSDTRLNTPGKSEGNWSYRITKEQLLKINKSYFRNLNEIYGRNEKLK